MPNTCFICRDDLRESGLINPCKCKGTCGTVHVECLEKWIEYKNSLTCNVCNTSYKVEEIYTGRLDKNLLFKILRSIDKISELRSFLGFLLSILLIFFSATVACISLNDYISNYLLISPLTYKKLAFFYFLKIIIVSMFFFFSFINLIIGAVSNIVSQNNTIDFNFALMTVRNFDFTAIQSNMQKYILHSSEMNVVFDVLMMFCHYKEGLIPTNLILGLMTINDVMSISLPKIKTELRKYYENNHKRIFQNYQN